MAKDSKKTGKTKRLKNLKPFKKGQSGNLKGRPKGSKNLSKVLKECGNTEVSGIDPILKKKVKKTCNEWLCIKLYATGMKGNVQAAKLIFERQEGKVAENMNIKINDSAQMEAIKAKMYDRKKRDEEKNE
jgi:hypothetical protein